MEQKIQDQLAKAGLQSEKDLIQSEFDSLKGIDSEQLKVRQQQLAKMKHLLFRQEQKNKRMAKIKSKLYHKLKKKDKKREEGKARAYLEEVDPEAARELAHKEELKMAEERMLQRHGGHKKWARDMRRFKGKLEDKETRDQYHEMMREKNALKDRQRRTKAAGDFQSDDDSEDDSDLSESQLKQKAIDEIKGELSADESDGEEDSESEEQDGEITMNFGDKKTKKKEDKNAATGIMGMKFMKTAESNKKERLKKEAEMLVEQIEEDEALQNSSDDEDQDSKKPVSGGLFGSAGTNAFGKTSAKFGGQADESKFKIDTQEVLKAAKEIYQKQQSNPVQYQEQEMDGESSSDDSQSEMSYTSDDGNNQDEQALLDLIAKKEPASKAKKAANTEQKTKASNKAATTEVKFDTQNLDEFHTDHKKLIKEDQDEINMKKLFVTEEDNEVMEQFEKEK